MAPIFNLRCLLLSTPNMVAFHKKIVPEKDYLALKFRIHQWFDFEEFLKNGKPYRIFVQIILKEH